METIEKSFNFKDGTLKYVEYLDTETKISTKGQTKETIKSLFVITDPVTKTSTPFFSGDNSGTNKILPKVYNDSYMVYFMKGSNILYKIKPCKDVSDKLCQKYEFTGKKIKSIRQQGNFDVFIITLYDASGKEVEVLFDMKKFSKISEREFDSLEYGEKLKPGQRSYVTTENTVDGLVTTTGIVDILTGNIESAEITKEPEIRSIVVTLKKDYRKIQCMYDLNTKSIISDCFKSIGERVESGVPKEESDYRNPSNFFVDDIAVGGDIVTIVGIVNKFGQIAPQVFNITAKEMINVPLIKEDGIDKIDRERLAKLLSTERRSINVDNAADTIRKANREFLINGMSKKDVVGIKKIIIGPIESLEDSSLYEAKIDAGDYQLAYTLGYNENGDIISAQLKPITYESAFEEDDKAPELHELFGTKVSKENIRNMLNGVEVEGLSIKASAILNNNNTVSSYSINITGNPINNGVISVSELFGIAQLDVTTIIDNVNLGLVDPKSRFGREELTQVVQKKKVK